eukprot:UN26794
MEYFIDEDQLKEAFGKYGEIENIKVRSNATDIFAFITFVKSEAAGKSIEKYNGTILHGTKIKVSWGAYNGDRERKKIDRIRSQRRRRDYEERRDDGYRPRYRRFDDRRGYSRERRPYRPRYEERGRYERDRYEERGRREYRSYRSFRDRDRSHSRERHEDRRRYEDSRRPRFQVSRSPERGGRKPSGSPPSKNVNHT